MSLVGRKLTMRMILIGSQIVRLVVKATPLSITLGLRMRDLMNRRETSSVRTMTVRVMKKKTPTSTRRTSILYHSYITHHAPNASLKEHGITGEFITQLTVNPTTRIPSPATTMPLPMSHQSTSPHHHAKACRVSMDILSP
jgi:hypothetical protein